MDYPTFDPNFSANLLAQTDKLYAALRTPNKAAAPAAPAAPAPLPPNGVMTDIGHGLASGVMVGAPTMIGQAMKYFSPDSGAVHDAGQSLVDSAEARSTDPLYRTTGAWGAGADMLASGLPALVAAPAAAALGAPALAVGAVGGLAGAALFGGSSAQSKYESELKLGATPEEASSTAAKEGLIQGVGQGVASAVGARALTGTAGALARGLGMAGESTAQGAFNSFISPAFMKQLGLGVAENLGVQVPVQMGAAAASAALGKQPTDSWEAAKASVAPTLAMGALMTPLIGGGTLLNNHRRAQIAETAIAPRPPDITDPVAITLYDKNRGDAIRHIYTEMRKVDPAGADKWRLNAEVVVARGEALPLDVGFDPDAPTQGRPPFSLQPSDPNAPPEFQLQPPQENAPTPVPGITQEQPTQGQLDFGDQRQGELPLSRNMTPEETAAQLREGVTNTGPQASSEQQPNMFAGPAQEINVHTPEHYQPETIDVHGIPEPEQAHEMSVEHIDIHSPEALDRAAQTIDITAPREWGTGRGNGMSPDEAAARLQAAKSEEGVGQGTARALGLVKDSPIVKATDTGTAYGINKQSRVQWLRNMLGATDAKNDLIGKLAALEPNQLAGALQDVWHEKGGANGPKYLIKVELLYKQLTGKDIREVHEIPAGGGDRDHFALTSPTAEDVQRAHDLAADNARGTDLTPKPLTAQEKAQITKRQGDLFKPQKPMTKAQIKAQEDAAKLLTKRVTDEAASADATEAGKGTKPESTSGEARSKNAASVDQVAQEKGDANAGRGDSEAAKGEGDLDPKATFGLQGEDTRKVVSASIRVGGQEFDAPVHGAALNKAVEAGALRKNPNGGWLVKDGNAWRKFDATKGDDYGLFRTDDGKLVSREEATSITGKKQSEQMPFGKEYKAANPVPPSRAEITAARKEAQIETARQAAEAKVEQIGAAIERHKAETLALKAQLQEIAAKPLPTRTSQDTARMLNLEAQIRERDKREALVVQMKTDAMGEAEDAAHGNPEQPRSKSEYLFTESKWDDRAGIGNMSIDKDGVHQSAMNEIAAANNLMLMTSWVSARITSGTATKLERTISNIDSTNRSIGNSAANKRAAADALRSLSPAEFAKYEARAEHFAKSLILYRSMRDSVAAKEKENRAKDAKDAVPREVSVAKPEVAVRKVMAAINAATKKAQLNKSMNAVLKAEEEGRITADERAIALGKIAEKMQEMTDKGGVYERGINGLNDTDFGDHVGANPTAKAAMEYIARNHDNPIMRMVAKLLGGSDHLNARVVVVDDPAFDGGRYVPRTNTIEIGRGGMNAITLMHESVHALAHRALGDAILNRNRTDLTGQQKRNVDALNTIDAIREKFRDIADLDDPSQRLALESAHEFTAEALNNPLIAEMLGGRSGLWTRFTNALRAMVGIEPKHQTDFEDLLSATKTLFGDPRHDTMEIFNRGLTGFFKKSLDPSNPTDAVEIQRRATDKMAAVSSKLLKSLRESDAGARGHTEAIKFLTLNHQMWLADRISSTLMKKFPDNAVMKAALDKLNTSINFWKQTITDRGGQSQHLINGKGESNDLMHEMLNAADASPAAFSKMTQMARNAKYAGVHPADLTLADAQKRVKGTTAEDFNHSTAVEARKAYSELQRSNPEMVKLYDNILQKHRLDFARYYATVLENTLKLQGLHKLPAFADRMKDLDWTTHKDLDRNLQEAKLNDAMKHMQGKLDELHENAKLSELKKVNDDITANNAKDGASTPLVDKLPPKHAPESQAFKDSTMSKSIVDDLLGNYRKQAATPYVHIGRSGDYHMGFEVANTPGAWDRVGKVITGSRAEGGLERDWHTGFGDKRKVYMKFGSAAELNEAMARVKSLKDAGLFKDAEGKDSYYDGKVLDHEKNIDTATPQFVQALIKRYNDEPNLSHEEKQLVINTLIDTHRQQLPETSPLKAAMFAENTPGASQNMLRTFGDRMTMSNQSLINARAAPRMAEGLAQLRKSISDLNTTDAGNEKLTLANYAKEWMGRAVDLQTPVNSPVIDTVKGLTAAWDLAMSPAYTAMTAWQPWQMSMPAIGSKYGMFRAASTMASKTGEAIGILSSMLKLGWGQEKGDSYFNRAASLSDIQLRFKELKKADGTPLLSGETLNMLERLQWSGMMNFGQTQQIMRMDPSSKNPMAKFIRIATVMPHYAEMLNRIVTATTAFEMARKHGKMDEKAAQDYALQTVTNTDGNHSQANVARALGRRGIAGKATPLFVGFGQYDIQMTEQLARVAMDAWGNSFTNKEARQAQKQLLGIATMTSLMAGTLGLPMMGMLTATANALGTLFGDDNDSPPDFQRAWRAHMDGIFGEKGGEIVSKGLPRALDFDMSSRSGYQDLLPFTTFLTDRRKMDDRLKDGAVTLLGPAMGIGMGILKGREDYARGDMVSAINDALPAGARNLAKAYRLAKYGYETQGGNNEIPITPSSWNVFMQAGGFVGGKRAEQSERSFQFQTNNDLLQRRQQDLRNAAYRAYEHGDYDAIGNIMRENINFAVQHPQFRADVGSGLVDRAKQRAIGANMGGMMLNPRQSYFAQQMFPSLQPYQSGQPQ